jgi:FG-GAP repeat
MCPLRCHRRAGSLFVFTLLCTAALASAALGAQVCTGIGPTDDDRAYFYPPEFADLAFGAAVGVSGNTAMAGMPAHNGYIGRVGVYTLSDGTWERTATLTGSNPADIRFGGGVDLDGNRALIGSVGAAYLFQRVGTQWHQRARLVSNSTHRTLQPVVEHEHGVIAVSAQGENLPGAVYVFEPDANGAPQRTAILKASDGHAGDDFGSSIAMQRDKIVIGAPNAGSSGAVYIFRRIAGHWSQIQKLESSDRFAGGHFGFAVAIRNDALIVGAPDVDLPGDDDTFTPEGNAYVFLRNGDVWHESQKLNDGQRTFFASFGTRVAMGQGRVAISAPLEDTFSRANCHVFGFR